jgi:hypothetical protein
MARRLVEVLSLESYIVQDDGLQETGTLDLVSGDEGQAFACPAIEDNQIAMAYALGDAASSAMETPISLLDGDVQNWSGMTDSQALSSMDNIGMDGRLIRTLVEEVVSHRLKNRSVP